MSYGSDLTEKLNWYMMECHLVMWMPAYKDWMLDMRVTTTSIERSKRHYLWLNIFGIERKKQLSQKRERVSPSFRRVKLFFFFKWDSHQIIF